MKISPSYIFFIIFSLLNRMTTLTSSIQYSIEWYPPTNPLLLSHVVLRTASQGENITSTYGKNRKYSMTYLRFENPCATILAISVCDFFVCTCDFRHTCDISCETILAIFFASMLHEIASMEGQRDRLRAISQVFQG